MRKLASIQSITALEPIPKADAIEVAHVLGWRVVVKRGEFRPGDHVVYCEIDSLLPIRPEFEFLRPNSFKAEIVEGGELRQRAGFRIKTVKLRGQVSQGICFPPSILPAGSPTEEGADVSELLGVIKYEPPVPAGMGGRVKGGFPGFLPKTDEIRVQVLESILERHRGRSFAITEKLDGTSFTAFLRAGEFGICSRNQWLDETDPTSVFARLAKSLDLPAKLAAARTRFGYDLAVQGEVIGPGIQGNKYALRAVTLRVFNVLDLDSGRLVDRANSGEVLSVAGLVPVPELGELTLIHTVDELVQFAIGVSALNPRTQREGIVLRPPVEEYDPDVGGRLSFKVINPQFLLTYDE